MKRSIGGTAVLIAALLLAGCGRDKPVGGVSPDEAVALNNAAEMLDASPDGLAAPVGMQPANGAESEGDASDNTQNSSAP